jgi:copper chaperone
MAEDIIKIKGMSCQHCVMAVKKALGTLDGISQTDVDIGSAAVTYDELKVKKNDIESAIEKAGYEVVRHAG